MAPPPASEPSRLSARVSPHNLSAEESLLGAMLLSREAIAAATEIVRPEHFYKPAHGHVFDAVASLYSAGEPADPITVSEELNRAGLLEAIGGPATLVALQASAPAVSNARRHAEIVEELALLRSMISTAGEIAELGYSLPDDVEKAVDQAEAMIFNLAQHRVTTSTASVHELLGETLDRLEQLYERGESITGTPTGYIDLDELLAGLQPNALVVVGARPAMGKTSFALGMASHAALATHKPTLVFSLEMSRLEITQRLLSSEARVDAGRMRTGKLSEGDWEKIGRAVGPLAEAPIWIDDNPNVTVMEIRSKARKLKSQVGELGLVVVDYIQLMTGRTSAESRQVEVAEISRGLKILAREIEAPVVALAQLNRGLEQRADKRPMLSDLRESGCVPASTRVQRADTGEEITIGELVLRQCQPLVWSMDSDDRLVASRLVRAFPTGIKKCFRLTLASGRSIEATANHPLLTVEGWRRLDELAVGSFVATPRHVPVPLATNTDWSDDEVVLLAHLLGDGTMGPSFKYATADAANLEAVRGAAQRCFGVEAATSKRGNTWQVWFPSPYRLTHGRRHPMTNWLEPLGLLGARSWTKFVPEAIFGLPDAQVALFLRHLWATDGSLTTGRNARCQVVRIYYATTSRRLAGNVQRLLLRFGIRSSIGMAKKQRAGGGEYRPGYSVRIQGSANQLRFLDVIGCHGSRGGCVPDARAIVTGVKENPNVDLVPWEIAGAVNEDLNGAGWTQRQLAAALGERYCGSYLLGSEQRPRRFSRDRLRRMGELLGSTRLVAAGTSDVYWDEIVSVESTGLQPTFDVTVEGTHNFIANGIVVHNSLEQDADVVLFLYRDEIYNRETQDQGIAEVIVAKHRAGPTGTVRLAFLGQYTKFANMAPSGG